MDYRYYTDVYGCGSLREPGTRPLRREIDLCRARTSPSPSLGTHCVAEYSTSPRSNLACVAREDSAGIEQPRLKPQSRAQPDLRYAIEFSLEISLNFVSTYLVALRAKKWGNKTH